MGVMHITEGQWDEMMAAFKKADDWRADQMPDEAAAIRVMNEAYKRLQELGWRERMYAPRGQPLELIEMGSTGIHKGQRGLHDEDDRFWVFDGDCWPSQPVLWRLEVK